jgi:hypothetical protein
MSRIMKLLVVANRSIETQEVRDAIVRRAEAGPVHVTLVAPSCVGAGPLCAPRTPNAEHVQPARDTATAERLERAVQQLRDAGVAVDGVVGGDPDSTGTVQDTWDPSRFDEVVVSCVPWLSFKRDVYVSDPTGP